MSLAKRRTMLCVLLLVVGCGEGSSDVLVSTSSGTATGTAITGNVVLPGGTDSHSILVFAYGGLPPDGEPALHEPASVSSVGADGSFGLSIPSADVVTIVFLSDSEHDGAIDPADPVAFLRDPERQLQSLPDGSRVELADVRLTLAKRHAVAGSITVLRAPAPDPAPTVTPVTPAA